MPRVGVGVIVIVIAVAMGSSHVTHAAGIGGASDNPGSGGDAQISTWVLGAVNGGVSQPSGATSCTEWQFFNGSNFGSGGGDPSVINPATGEPSLVYARICDGRYQFVYVGPYSPADVARVAYQQVAEMVPRPEVAFSPPIDKMLVNFETWLGVTPLQPVSATASIPGLSATVTAEPVAIEWATGSRVAGDAKIIHCEPWGSTDSAQDGCAWTPAYPSIRKVTGTSDSRYHGTVTIVWRVSWRATNRAQGSLPDLHTTTPVNMAVQEVQTIGG